MKKFYHFIIEGGGIFPVDMLRYDHCWPTSSVAVTEVMAHEYKDTNRRRTVELASWHPPTKGRWESFGWRIVPQRVGMKMEDVRITKGW